MTATCTQPVLVPPGARTPFRAPAPDVLCPECEGTEPDLDFEGTCAECGGSGVATIAFFLPEMRSQAYRRVVYRPMCRSGQTGNLLVETAGCGTHRSCKERYHVAEFESDFAGRSFAVQKQGKSDIYHVYVGPAWVTCDCAGASYLAAAKANQAAWEAGDEVFPSWGCKHSDACHALLLGGWFDLGGTDAP